MESLSRVTNMEVAAILHEVADLLEIKGVRFKPQAYRRAAQAIETLPEDIADVAREGDLDEIPGVGKSIAAKIREVVETGSLRYLASLREELPEGVQYLTRLEGIGPKKAIALSRELGIRTVTTWRRRRWPAGSAICPALPRRRKRTSSRASG